MFDSQYQQVIMLKILPLDGRHTYSEIIWTFFCWNEIISMVYIDFRAHWFSIEGMSDYTAQESTKSLNKIN